MYRNVLALLLGGLVCAALALAPGAGQLAWAALQDQPAEQETGHQDTDAEKADDGEDHGSEDSGDGHGDGHGSPLENLTHADLSHGNATEALETPSELKFSLALYTFVVFLGLLAILFKFAWRPIMDGLDKREKSIEDMIAAAKKDHEAAQAVLRRYEMQLAQAADEAQQMVAKARHDAEAVGQRIRDEAEEAATRERDRAVQDIKSATDAALQEVASRGADMAFQLAGKILERELNREDHSRLITDTLKQLPSSN